MRRQKTVDKLLVIITIAISIVISTITYWIDLSLPKEIDIENGLSFGTNDSPINLVIFEDFKCKYCKKYANEIFPLIKEKYLDTNIIDYTIMPVAFIYGSKPIANAAIAIYELQQDQFFEFLKIISEKKAKVNTKEDLIEIASSLEGINLEIFKDFLEDEVFNKYLKKNLLYAKKIMRSFEVPTVYINGQKVDIDQIINKIEETLNYKKLTYRVGDK